MGAPPSRPSQTIVQQVPAPAPTPPPAPPLAPLSAEAQTRLTSAQGQVKDYQRRLIDTKKEERKFAADPTFKGSDNPFTKSRAGIERGIARFQETIRSIESREFDRNQTKAATSKNAASKTADPAAPPVNDKLDTRGAGRTRRKISGGNGKSVTDLNGVKTKTLLGE